MTDFFAFRKMITPAVIQIIFWLGVSICIVTGIGLISNSFHSPLFRETKLTVGLLVLIVGPIVVRIICELQIVIFRIGDTLIEIRNNIVSNVDSVNNPSVVQPVEDEPETKSFNPPFKTKEEYEKWKAERMKKIKEKDV